MVAADRALGRLTPRVRCANAPSIPLERLAVAGFISWAESSRPSRRRERITQSTREAGPKRGRGAFFCSARSLQAARELLRATMVARALALGATKTETKRKA